MELSGTIKRIGDIQTYASGFQKREFVLLTQEQYPQPINLELFGDKIDIIDPFKEGDSVTVGINIRGRSWTSPQGEVKYFNTISAWKIINANSSAAQQPTQTNTQKATATPEQAFGESGLIDEEEDDDLTF